MTDSDNKIHAERQLILQYMAEIDENPASQIALIGCCGAYCGTCPALKDNACKGCRLGYDNGVRDIRAARCAIKRCCLMDKKLNTCADCPDYPACRTIQRFFTKNGYKYRKYRESLEFIKQQGYPAFIEAAHSWKRAYGTLK